MDRNDALTPEELKRWEIWYVVDKCKDKSRSRKFGTKVESTNTPSTKLKLSLWNLFCLATNNLIYWDARSNGSLKIWVWQTLAYQHFRRKVSIIWYCHFPGYIIYLYFTSISWQCKREYVLINFLQSPRRDCCRVMPSKRKSQMQIWVGRCREGEISEV